VSSAEPTRILVVEDDAALAAGIVKGLKRAGFAVELCSDGDQALEKVPADPPDLVVLDLMLPGRSGFELLQAWQGRVQVPILVLTARTDLEDRLRSFTLGAVDFLPKPFWMEELLVRIRTRLRLREAEPPRRIAWDGVEADLDARRVVRAGEDVGLTAYEFNVLAFLIERPERACSRAQIAGATLSTSEEIDDRTVDSHLARIRKKLGHPAADAFQTVWGIGYRFSPDAKPGGER